MGDALIGTDGMSLYSMIAIGVVIVAAIAVIVWNLRRRGHMAFMRGGTNRQPRLAILDAAAVDARRRLVLIRRDNVEHLVMIGGPSDIVVERGINRAAARAAQQENAAAQTAQGTGPSARQPQQKPPQPKAPPQKPASEPIATEPLNIPASKPDEPPAPAKPRVTEPKEAKPPQQPPAAAKPKPEPAPKPVPAPAAATPAPELAAVAVSSAAAVQIVEATDNEDAIAAELEDALEAARDLVMPDAEPDPVPAPAAVEPPPAIMTPETPPKASHPVPDAAPAPQPESMPAPPVANDAAGPSPAITADDLIADFDKVLEAEISKTEQDAIQAKPTDVDDIAPASEKEPEPVANAPSASLEDEMKKLLGDLTVKH